MNPEPSCQFLLNKPRTRPDIKASRQTPQTPSVVHYTYTTAYGTTSLQSHPFSLLTLQSRRSKPEPGTCWASAPPLIDTSTLTPYSLNEGPAGYSASVCTSTHCQCEWGLVQLFCTSGNKHTIPRFCLFICMKILSPNAAYKD